MDITGVRSNSTNVLVPNFFLVFCGMLEMAESVLSTISDTSNVALTAGSSQHGKARLASAASNCVVARYFFLPALSLY